MQLIKNDTNDVFKGISDNGYETIIKSVEKLSNKTTMFISSSVGCPLKCKFCHLTIKGYKFNHVQQYQMLNNILQTFEFTVKHNPHILKKPLKLAWMGMGDAFFSFENIVPFSKILIDLLPCKLDRIDVSTALPSKFSSSAESDLTYIKSLTLWYPSKIFYSLFSVKDDVRQFMMPNTVNSREALELFKKYKVPINIHQIFLEGVNDTQEEVEGLVDICNEFKVDSLRILRYNDCKESWFYESDHYQGIERWIAANIEVSVKFQDSPGKEVKAACGMFG